MYAYTFYIYLSTGRVEVLKLQLAQVTAIHGVGPLASEFLYVEVVCTHTNLLVGVKSYAYVSVTYLFVIAQIAHRLYYLSYAGLVVGAKQRCSVGHNQVFACVLQQLREFLRRHDYVF